MVFRLNRKGLSNLKRLELGHIQFIAARRPIILTQLSRHDEERFLCQAGGDGTLLVADCLLAHHRLHIAGAVTDNQKVRFTHCRGGS